jgi:DHA2 family multidrug resistance protein
MTYLPKGQQPLGLSLFTLAISFAPCIGPTIGGWLTVNYSWSFIFYVNLIPGLVLCYLVSRGLEDQPAQLGLFAKGDWGGILSMALALGSLTVVLEEGVRKDWWGSGLIRDLSVLSAVSFALFLYLELTKPEPFINLRLLKRRNFLLAALAGMVFGAGTYGSIFIIPLFLARITGLDAEQTGGIIMWAGLPQLFIIPFFPLLVKRFDSRLLSAFGFALFGLSLFMNSGLTADWGHDQFFWSQIVRAAGQPFIMTPLLGLAYVGVEASEMGSASGLFNMMRDLGGTLGIGLIGTLLDNRYHLHFTRIAEAVSRFSPQASLQIAHRAEFLAGRSPWGGLSQSLATVFDTMNRQAFVMAFADCFFAMALVFVISVSLVLMMKKAASPAGPRADH